MNVSGIFVVLCAVAFLITIFVISLIAIRFWPIDTDAIQMDAFEATELETPNFFINDDDSGRFEVASNELAAVVNSVISRTSRTQNVGSSADNLSQTYITRSALFSFPDFASVSIRENSDGSSQLKIFSRARFGYSDLGVNKRRVLHWLAEVRTQVGA